MQSEIKKLPFGQVANFPKLFLDYVSRREELKPLYGHFPDIEGFRAQVKAKKFTHRAVLTAALKRQYAGMENLPRLDLLLQENTFTVTTGHQLNIFTGPLYVIYKIVSTINLAAQLKAAMPEYNFVPVYWMATEDHDFEEIASFHLFGQKYTWETDQKGAVGEMDPEGISRIFDELKDKPEVFRQAYAENDTLAGAVRRYMHALFGEHGLVCVDGNDHELKRLFAPAMWDELQNHSVKKALDASSAELEKLGYKPQINGRDINLFYKDSGLRERIEFNGDRYTVVDTAISFTPGEMKALLDESPEKISPNVAMRPLYEEMILPNLAYLGGPSELAYWLQLKGIFEHYNVAFPVLLPRNMALVVNGSLKKRMDKLGVSVEELYLDDAALRKTYVEKHSENSLSLKTEEDAIAAAFAAIVSKAREVDPTLEGVIEAEKTKALKSLNHLEARIKKAEERKFDTAISQLTGLKEKLFPGGSQQERKDNFLNFFLNDPAFIDKLFAVFDPLDLRFNVIYI
ncbi:bacillithiol biosynthesis cysteine-adding enzyme BshC [Leadbetterella sp. DM7]|uniref:bacillithiol biosynthesis cysteine-adding enzyme BshC n=1 Tax=Leadbetterella sp. DM7 TaxID=3235085 RepID=UPI00349E5F86